MILIFFFKWIKKVELGNLLELILKFIFKFLRTFHIFVYTIIYYKP